MSREGNDELAGGGDDKIGADRLVASIVAGETDLLKRHFVANGASPPALTWSPATSELGTPILHSFADICDDIGTESGLLSVETFRLEDFDGLDRWMMVLTRDGPHYRYDHYGAEIRNHYGTDMTGRSTADFENYIGTFFAALYDAARTRGERVLSVHEPPMRVFVRAWRRLIVPAIDASGDITGFVAANIPDNELRAGLEMIVDPVFVTDRDGIVQYFNDAASDYFAIAPGQRRSLNSLTRLDIGDVPAPEVLLARHEVVERLDLVERKGGVMDRLAVSISAAEHRGQAYYVLLLRGIAGG